MRRMRARRRRRRCATRSWPRPVPRPAPQTPREPQRRVSLLDRALAFWSWLARPPVAAGFASVMAATLVGMLWWDRPMDETMVPPPSSPTASAPRPAPERGPAAGEKRRVGRADADRAAAPPADRTAASWPDRRRPIARRATGTCAGEDGAAAGRRRGARRDGSSTQAAGRTRDRRSAMRAQADAKPAAKSEEATAERKDDKLERARPPSAAMAPAAATTPAPSAARPAAEAPTPFPARSPAEADTATRQAAPARRPDRCARHCRSAQQPAPAQGRAEPFALAKKAESRENGRARPPRPDRPRRRAELRAPAAGTLGGAALDSSEASTAGRIAAQNAAGSGPRQRIVPRGLVDAADGALARCLGERGAALVASAGERRQRRASTPRCGPGWRRCRRRRRAGKPSPTAAPDATRRPAASTPRRRCCASSATAPPARSCSSRTAACCSTRSPAAPGSRRCRPKSWPACARACRRATLKPCRRCGLAPCGAERARPYHARFAFSRRRCLPSSPFRRPTTRAPGRSREPARPRGSRAPARAPRPATPAATSATLRGAAGDGAALHPGARRAHPQPEEHRPRHPAQPRWS